jgi:MoxR-like ATPase
MISNLRRSTIHLNNEDKIFNNIYSRGEIKQIILMALRAEQPVHVLLTGAPGCGKTQFLENIKGYYKDKAYFTIGAHSNSVCYHLSAGETRVSYS